MKNCLNPIILSWMELNKPKNHFTLLSLWTSMDAYTMTLENTFRKPSLPFAYCIPMGYRLWRKSFFPTTLPKINQCHLVFREPTCKVRVKFGYFKKWSVSWYWTFKLPTGILLAIWRKKISGILKHKPILGYLTKKYFGRLSLCKRFSQNWTGKKNMKIKICFQLTYCSFISFYTLTHFRCFFVFFKIILICIYPPGSI